DVPQLLQELDPVTPCPLLRHFSRPSRCFPRFRAPRAAGRWRCRRCDMPKPMLERWTVALAAAERAVVAALRAHTLSTQDAAAERLLLEAELRWLATLSPA